MSSTFSKRKIAIFLVAAAVVIALAVGLVWIFAINKSEKLKGAIVTNGHGCSDIGKSIFDHGGSVADVAIASLFCEGVSLPQSMGLGGGFLLTIYDRETGIVKSLNAREKAPKAANETMFDGNPSSSKFGGLAVAVPGELKGYWFLYKQYGYLPWADLIQPTIDLCKNGIYVTEFLARTYLSRKDTLYADPVLRDSFINPETNTTYTEGEYVKRLRLAKTLEIIATEGVDALYSKNGSLIDGFVKDIQDNGGIITAEDLIEYEPIWQEPITASMSDGQTLYTTPLPGSGSVLTYILQILDGFIDLNHLYTGETFQRIVEAFKFGYGSRTNLGDDMYENVTSVVNDMVSKSYAEQIRSLIKDDSTSQNRSYYGAYSDIVEDHGTAHISILAPNGDAISVTSTINLVFGAGFASNSTGIILNDEMDDFSTPSSTSPSPTNFIKPGKRPLSSMVPSIILKDKDVVLVAGAAGGTKITTVVASVILKHLWYNVDLNEAITEKRVHHQLSPMTVEFEEGFDEVYPDIVKKLTEIGHETKFTPTSDGFSAVTAVTKKNNTLQGAFDDRRGGYVTFVER
ncbi:glutathione hydrolase 1 proenzyme [Dendroctonus ponderosae]|uniref:Gamma-glutamyltransferase n=1 Tax=Dendroctonus ponderosae TaxID=77166 RepID=A0AAR5PJ67_DENPD|nr:glutathione hydrolase 1 proenzyme [Dendroctonus ponderosae]KAH1015855.1 hypothetical protein HUJ04_007176 [Dendroctonus ponderosae]KAH1015856.1 hypothetical protein HUJ04_007176 [Dendroctonus ponderosae]KAH1025135.1 hypothetical protein HUJ05_009920 [Dendroctonus ponderosae]KAH1025136.1 hypothetical protein HUJ05_009920 [Dendroctonus ponderosae]